jgi:nucleotide-binding universal stress UspA family protein
MKPVVVAVDGSTAARHALDAGVALAARQSVPLHVVHVLAAPNWEAGGVPRRPLTADEEHALHRAEAHAAERGVAAQVELLVEEGSPAQTIADYAQRVGADVIVIGSRRRTGVGAAVLGSVSQGVVHHATLPVLVVPEGTALA